ncbi:pyridoxal phosphate-dependent aminotransferase [Pontivivens insulae]|uniref:aspartate transaminase n=1 Tax=Pontivivens insulae TaxID=1639689 RepID=A0A2R8ABX1_9RHOB|nr:aminotransferase class I/II-fold pyridoxal phosphate-dependent enzyme [Pontivivens insulae]RED11076.1 arginine:pyruvate transaminase [Pontivivens insulae]SPF29749.1 Arginine--pyruvate transaminase AruH [Pontivivens insulae]
MQLSSRIRAIPEPAGNAWEIYERAQEMRTEGIDVTMLSIGDHDTITPEPIIAHMAGAARQGNTGYASVPGMAPLRAAIAERATLRTGAAAVAGNVFVTPGGQFALFEALMAVTDPGDKVVMIDPYYATYPITIRAAGAAPVIVKADPDNGFQPDLQDMAAKLPGCRALLLNTPNNPTGAVYSRDTLNAIAELCQAHDVWLISDEVYDGQIWEGEHLSPRGLPGMAERTIVIGSMSKSHIMTGFRLGWVLAPEQVVNAIWELAIATTYGVPGFIQEAACFALTEGDAIEAEATARYRSRRDLAVDVLRGANGLRLSAPQGAMYVMVDIRPTGLSGIAFARKLLEEHHIAVMPGEGFGQAAAGHLRVSLTLEDDALVAALRTLAGLAGALAV